MEIDWNSDEAKQALAAAVAKETEGLKTNRDTVFREKEVLQGQLAELQGVRTTVESLGGVDGLKTLAKLKARLDADEETRLIAEGKLDQVLERRMEPTRKTLAELQDTIAKEKETAAAFKERYRRTALDNAVAQTVSGLQDGALEVVQRLAREMLTVGDDDKITPVDGSAVGLDGLKDDLVQRYPYLFQNSNGGLARGDATGGAGARQTMRRSEFDQLGTKEQHAFMRGKGKVVDG